MQLYIDLWRGYEGWVHVLMNEDWYCYYARFITGRWSRTLLYFLMKMHNPDNTFSSLIIINSFKFLVGYRFLNFSVIIYHCYHIFHCSYRLAQSKRKCTCISSSTTSLHLWLILCPGVLYLTLSISKWWVDMRNPVRACLSSNFFNSIKIFYATKVGLKSNTST